MAAKHWKHGWLNFTPMNYQLWFGSILMPLLTVLPIGFNRKFLTADHLQLGLGLFHLSLFPPPGPE